MNIKFEDSAYLFTFLATQEQKDKQAILEYANLNPHFQYGSVNFEQYSIQYKSDGWLARKVFALPMAAWSGIVKTTYHLAIAILIGIPTSLFNEGRRFKANLFNAARDFQECFGRILSIIDDKSGLYHIEESQFHKSCYEAFNKNSHEVYPQPIFNNPAPQHNPRPGLSPFIPPQPQPQPTILPSANTLKIPAINTIPLLKVPPNPTLVEGPIVKEAMESFADLKAMTDGLLDCIGSLNELQKAYNQRGIDTPEYRVLDITKAYFEATKLPHPLANPATIVENLNKWSLLLEKFHEAQHTFFETKWTNDEIPLIIKSFEGLNPSFHCLAKGYYDLGNLDQAFKHISETNAAYKYKDSFLIRLANDHYKKGDLKTTFSVIKALYDYKTREAYFQHIAYEYYKKGQVAEALEVNKAIIHDHKAKEAFITQIARDYYTQGQLEDSFNVIKDIIHDHVTKEIFYANIALAYTKNGDVKNGLKTIKEIIHDHKTKENFFEYVSTIYFQNGDLENSKEVIKEIIHDHKCKEGMFVKIAQAYAQKGDIPNGLKVINEMVHDHKAKEIFFKYVSDLYIQKGDLENGLKSIKEIIHDHQYKEEAIAKIAQAYVQKGDFKNALKTIKEIIHDHKTKEKFFKYVSDLYFQKGDLENSLKVIEEITHDYKSREEVIAKIAEAYYLKGKRRDAKDVANRIFHDYNGRERLLQKFA